MHTGYFSTLQGFLTNNTMRGYIFVAVYFLACISVCEALYSKKVFNSFRIHDRVLVPSEWQSTLHNVKLHGDIGGQDLGSEFFSVVTSNDWSIVSRGMSDNCDNFDVQFGGVADTCIVYINMIGPMSYKVSSCQNDIATYTEWENANCTGQDLSSSTFPTNCVFLADNFNHGVAKKCPDAPAVPVSVPQAEPISESPTAPVANPVATPEANNTPVKKSSSASMNSVEIFGLLALTVGLY
jgi:hypothetical protein